MLNSEWPLQVHLEDAQQREVQRHHEHAERY
jgi:hypothetical protein